MVMDDIRNKIRYLLNDNLTTISDVFTYGSSTAFSLTESNSPTITDVEVNDVSSGTTYSFNSTNNKLTVTSSLVAGDTVKISYTCYQNYSDTELTNYIQAALLYLSINNLYTFTYDSTTDDIYPAPEAKEENLIAIVTATFINPDNKTIRLPDITLSISSEAGGSTEQKISKLIAHFKKDTHGVFDILN